MQRVGVFAGCDGLVTYYNPLSLYGITGIQTLAAPFIICALTVLNVMLAAVYERIGDIRIFSALGIDPRGIATMFLAESVLFGVISSLGGYLISMSIISFLSYANLNPTGMPLNYASTFVIVAIGITTATAVASTLFPASKASQLVTPSLKRHWEISTSPVGDDWSVPLPFVLNPREAAGALLFLGEYAEVSTATYGNFAVDATSIRYSFDENAISLDFHVRLAPFDLNIAQDVKVTAAREADRMDFVLVFRRTSGHMNQWVLTNYRFVDALRKQLLLWRILKPIEKEKYMDQGEEMFS